MVEAGRGALNGRNSLVMSFGYRAATRLCDVMAVVEWAHYIVQSGKTSPPALLANLVAKAPILQKTWAKLAPQINEPSGEARCKLRHVQPVLIRFEWLLYVSLLFFPVVEALVPRGGRRHKRWGDYFDFKSSTQLSIVFVSPGHSPWGKFTVITKRHINLRRSADVGSTCRL